MSLAGYFSVGLAIVLLMTFAVGDDMRKVRPTSAVATCAIIVVIWPVFLLHTGRAIWRASRRC